MGWSPHRKDGLRIFVVSGNMVGALDGAYITEAKGLAYKSGL
jgi:hypothetical protein